MRTTGLRMADCGLRETPDVDVDAIAFDVFGTLFDLGAAAEEFRTRVLPWTWQLSAAERFRPLPEIAGPALAERIRSLEAYPDVREGLDALAGTPLAILSNGTRDGVEELLRRAGIADRFQHVLTAEQVERYKPAPEVYALAPVAFGTAPDRVLLVSGNEWDVAGAVQAGLRTAWIARGREPRWVLGIEPDAVAEDVRSLARL